MNITVEDRHEIAETLRIDLNGKYDGGKRNLLLPECPWCGHGGYKFGIYVGFDNSNKRFGSSHCFHCSASCKTLKGTLELLRHTELMPVETEDLEEEMSPELHLFENEIDDEMKEVEMPEGYKRTFKNWYTKSRGWVSDDYDYFEVGTNRGMDWKLEDYIILPVIENGKKMAYVARHTWSKQEIEDYNDKHRKKILRYRNSTDKEGTGFEKLIYNIDAIEKFVTQTVIVCEGAFDVVGITRKLELYDNPHIKAVATFGKKISDVQIYKLQQKGIETVILGYDQDAVSTTALIAKSLEQYFDVLIVDIPSSWEEKDFDEMDEWQIYDLFSKHLLTVREFNLKSELV